MKGIIDGQEIETLGVVTLRGAKAEKGKDGRIMIKSYNEIVIESPEKVKEIMDKYKQTGEEN